MNLPPFLLAAAVMFWGWQCGQWWLAALVAVALEAPYIFRLRFTVSFPDLGRIANFCTLLLLAVFVYLFVSEGATPAIIAIIKWMPLILLPLFLAIAYSGMPTIDLSVISFASRRRALSDPSTSNQVDLGYPYLAVWTLTASTMNQQGAGFYLGLLGLGAWVLWRFRPAGRGPWMWGAVFLVAALGGVLISTGLYRLQEVIEQVAMQWLSSENDEDPERTRTSLGHIGELKLSDSIALRVIGPKPAQLPLLLRTASYNNYAAASWSVVGASGFRDLPRDVHRPAWGLRDIVPGTAAGTASMEISTSFARPMSLVALPLGALEVDGIKFIRMNRNAFGTVQAELAPGLHRYQVRYDATQADRAQPVPDDLKLPHSDRALLLDVVRRQQLEGKPPAFVMQALKRYFAENFSYSTFRAGNGAGHTALSDFLLRDRKGHCEHFASATVLLLRAAGIPARYAVGYSVQEPSRFGPGYVARRRHAHAWVSAYVDGAWQDVDTTPAAWPGLEQDNASMFEPLLDAWSWLWFYMQRLPVSGYEFLAYAAALLAFTWFGYKYLWRGGGLRLALQAKAAPESEVPPSREPEASVLYRIEKILAGRGLERPRNEPLTLWLARIAPQLDADASAALAHIVTLHYRCRFGPQPLPLNAREGLQRAGEAWIVRFGRAAQPQ